MNRTPLYLAALSSLALASIGCHLTPSAETTPRVDAPIATIKAHELREHGHTRIDNYFWLRERDNPEVIAYLEAENAYGERVLAPAQPATKKIYEEFVERLAEDDTSVPVRDGNWIYYSRNVKGKNYTLSCRRPAANVTDIATAANDASDEQILLDGNALAEGHDYFALSGSHVSPDGNMLVYAIDTVGRRFYTLRFKNLVTGDTLADVIPNVTNNVTWAADERTVFYTKQDPETLRDDRIYRHSLGTPAEQDVLVYEEKDVEFSCSVGLTSSKRYLTIHSDHTLADEFRVLEADHPTGEFRIVAPRAGSLYTLTHHGDSFYIRTNWNAVNFRLMRTPVDQPGRGNWREVIPHRADVMLSDITAFDSHAVISERVNGLRSIRIVDWNFEHSYTLPFDDAAYVAYVGTNRNMSSEVLRYVYSSMTTPSTTYEIDLASHDARLLKQEPIGGGYDPAQYVSERLWATARDGVRVPISLVRRRDTKIDGSAPLLLYGYGSYGFAMDPRFRSTVVSLLDRGFVYAIAHVRGGDDLGRPWYEDGKMRNKMNTFTDFNDCAHHLVATAYADPSRLYAQGGSAGGLLIGAVINLEPTLYHGVLAEVPFVDVVTTMLDDSIPLTTFEYDEWGNPNNEGDYDYMLSYSPYDQVHSARYPNLMVTTGLHDSQVQYWEPAKWVAKLRALKRGDNTIVLMTNMAAGHGGASGRYKALEETAKEYGFIARSDILERDRLNRDVVLSLRGERTQPENAIAAISRRVRGCALLLDVTAEDRDTHDGSRLGAVEGAAAVAGRDRRTDGEVVEQALVVSLERMPTTLTHDPAGKRRARRETGDFESPW